jgi:hypothetical protein
MSASDGKWPEYPTDLRIPTVAECRQLGKLRKLHATTFDLAARLGCLGISAVCGFKSWMLHDKKALAFEARRITGEPYPAQGQLSSRKTHTLRNSDKSWPIGLLCERTEVNVISRAIIGEGSAAYFELLELIEVYGDGNIQPMVFLGASVRSIHPEALIMLKRKEQILIVPDNDEAGRKAATTWQLLLRVLGKDIRIFEWPPNCKKIKDLGDALRLLPKPLLQQLADQILLPGGGR